MAHKKGKAGAKQKYTCDMILELLPQPSIKAWKAAAKDYHGMGEDAFDSRKQECSCRWEKTTQGGIVLVTETLWTKEKGGNGG